MVRSETSPMHLNNVEPNTLQHFLPFGSYDVITVHEFVTLFKKLMKVDWVFAERTVNLSERGWTIGWNSRKTALGVCWGGKKKILISKFLLEHNLDKPSEWEDTIRHEIAHAIEYELRGKSDHGRIWQRICHVTGASPTRTCKNPLNNGNTHKFELVCPNCDYSAKFYRKPQASDRACGKCCNKHNFGRFSKEYELFLVEV